MTLLLSDRLDKVSIKFSIRKRMNKISFAVGIFLFASGCTFADTRKAPPTRDMAKDLILPQIDLASFEKSYICEFNSSLSAKPEFSSLQGKDFCDTSFEITGIREEGEGRAVVEYNITTTFKISDLEEYSKAIDAFKNRLLSIKGVFDPSAANMGRSGVVNYVDPTDGYAYSVNVNLGNSTTVDNTREWRILSELQDNLNRQITNGSFSSVRTTYLTRYDDGWRAGGQ
jgi:hypothetical protein